MPNFQQRVTEGCQGIQTDPFDLGDTGKDVDVRHAMNFVTLIFRLDAAKEVELLHRYKSYLANQIARNIPDHTEERIDNAIDILWHFHILDMQNYRRFCLRNFGRVVEHKLPARPIGLEWLDRITQATALSEAHATERNVEMSGSGLVAPVAAAGQCSGPSPG